jgi:hypothetical protein
MSGVSLFREKSFVGAGVVFDERSGAGDLSPAEIAELDLCPAANPR